jgi:hypothetical protein
MGKSQISWRIIMKTFNADIIAATALAEQAFEAAHNILDGMQDGERIQIKDLAKDVGLAVALPSKDVLGFVTHFVHNTSIAYVRRGKHGGIIKGVKPVKLVKPAKKVKAAIAVAAPGVVEPSGDVCNF